MSRFLDERFRPLKEYSPGEQPKDTVYTKLNTNESPYPPGPATIRAVTDPGLASRLRLYSDPDSGKLKDALAETYGVGRENIFVSNGSDDILNFAFLAFGADGVRFPDVTYGFYPVFAKLHGRAFTEVPVREDFTIDPDDYAGKGCMSVLANPNAPTGLSLPLSALARIAESDPGHVLVVDEAYVDFGGETAVPLTKDHGNVLVCRTFSKSRSLAGARLGFAIGPAELISDLEKIKYSTNPYNVNSLTAAAGIAALSEDDYYRANARSIMDTRTKTTESLRALGFQVLPSDANFIFASHPDIDGGALYRTLKEKRILIRHFDIPRIRNYNRITIGTPADMEILLDAVRTVVRNSGGKA